MTISEAPETHRSSGDHIPLVNNNGQSKSSGREPSQKHEVSKVDSKIIKVPVEIPAVKSELLKIKSKVTVVDENKQRPAIKSEKLSKQEVCKDDSSSVDPLPEPKAAGEPATETQDKWSPLNLERKISYDREFLLQLQFAQMSTTKPKNLPDLPDIILDNPNLGNNTRGPLEISSSNPAHSGGFDFTPGYDRGTPSRGGNVPKRNSQGDHKSIPDRPSAHEVINLSSMQQEVELHKVVSAWKPSHKENIESKTAEDLKAEELYQKARSVLNNFTPQKLKTLVKQMSALEISSEEHLKGVVNLVFEKAIAEPEFIVAYASMCRYLTQIKVPSTSKTGKAINFHAILLTTCQKKFEKDKIAEDEIEMLRITMKGETQEEKIKAMNEEIELAETKNRKRYLGTIRFIGELFNLKIFKERFMHECVFKLLKNKDEDSLEYLCHLLRTIGKELDTDKAKPRIDQYFQRLKKLVEKKKTSSTVRSLMQDVIDLRSSNWVPRIKQIHKEAQQEEQEEMLMLQTVTVHPKTERGSRRGCGGPSLTVGAGDPDSWDTIGSRDSSMKDERKTIDSSSSKLSRQSVDDNIRLGPGGRAGRFEGWQRGSSGGGAKAASQKQRNEGKV